MKRLSAGILLYDVDGDQVKVLLAHPGGPFWSKKDLGAWSIPKGEYEEGTDPMAAALREFEEETGLKLDATGLLPLGEVRQSSGKLVTVWAKKGQFDVTKLVSNTFEMEWPKGTGLREFPEVDRAEWFSPWDARRKLIDTQARFIDRLIAGLLEDGVEVRDRR
ncbi:MAG TPA: NUDIX domain-containing protein [Actinocrinis sp.]|nr:NUDIX domain-containing protein [Actinocrinis sp.]